LSEVENGSASSKGTLFLLPNSLGRATPDWHSKELINAASSCQHFIVESHKMSRRLLHKLAPERDLDALEYYHLHKRVTAIDVNEMIQPLLQGHHMGLISDAGLPAVADPGSLIVTAAHRQSIRVSPIPGPSSIFLALMASGLNGQHFEFVGYVSQQDSQRKNQLKALTNKILKTGTTVVFIETPYRNPVLYAQILELVSPDLRLCLALDLTQATEEIATRHIADWKKVKAPNLEKRPCVFLLGK